MTTSAEHQLQAMDAAAAELPKLNRAVLDQRRQLEQAIITRNNYAYEAHKAGVSLGQLATNMGLTRSAVQAMIKNVENGEGWQA